jgi:lysophospholipase L1-like esterase
LLGGAAAAAGALAMNTSTAAAESRPDKRGWTVSWATALVRAAESDALAHAGFTGTTIRQVVRLSAGGRVRLRLANPFGREPLRIGPVTAGLRPDGVTGASAHVDAKSLTPVRFGGQDTGLLAAGATMVSDPVGLVVPNGGDLVVSMYLAGPTGPVSFHRNAHATGYLAQGEQTGAPGSAFGTPMTSFFLLAGVDTAGSDHPALAVLGDSITEGVGTTPDTNGRWPDHLARRLATGKRWSAVANLGISGNRLLLDHERFGQGAQARFDRDVLTQPGLSAVLVFLGINDVQQEPNQLDADVLLAGYHQLATRARDHGLRTLGGTITPFKGWQRFTPELESGRQRINAGIRERAVFDHVVDFDAALRDPADPERLRPDYDSGDGLHPSDAGAAALAAAVDRRLLA